MAIIVNRGMINMSVTFRHYTSEPGITNDYYKLRNFLIKLKYSEFNYSKWDWMITHRYLDKISLNKIGIWEENNEIIGAALYNCRLGTAFCVTDNKHQDLKQEMLKYAETNLNDGGCFGIVIRDDDLHFQDTAYALGYKATNEKVEDIIFYPLMVNTGYDVPYGFKVVDLSHDLNIANYLEILWDGFNHERDGDGRFVDSKAKEILAKQELIRPNVDLQLKIAVTDENGRYVSYCGAWYDKEAGFAALEPIATLPQYRHLGLARCAVHEAINRVLKMGAEIVIGTSAKQFLYNIGFRPFKTATIWSSSRY